MPAPLDYIGLANRALARIGSAPIFDLDDETELAAQVNAVLMPLILATFEKTRLTWMRSTRLLQGLAAPLPQNGYRYGFAFPGDTVGQPLKVSTDRSGRQPLREFTLEGRALYCDEPAVYGQFTLLLTPDAWPPLFTEAVTVALAAEFCIPVTHDAGLATQLRQQAWGTPTEGGRGGLMGDAMKADLAGNPGPQPLYDQDPLTSAHFSGALAGGEWWR